MKDSLVVTAEFEAGDVPRGLWVISLWVVRPPVKVFSSVSGTFRTYPGFFASRYGRS